MNPLRRAVRLVVFTGCLVAPAFAAVMERPAVEARGGLSAHPASIALALQTQILALTPVAGSPQLLAQTLAARLSAPEATPAEQLAGRYLISSLGSANALPLVQDFILRSQVPDATAISAGLASLARTVSMQQFEFKTPQTSLDLDRLRQSLDSMFENARGGGAVVDAGEPGLSSSGKIRRPLQRASPRAAPTIVGLGSFHENDPAKVIVMHAPGAELLFANTHPDSALFTDPVDWNKATVEHAGYREVLQSNGAKVYLVKDVLLEGTLDNKGEPLAVYIR